MIGKVQNFRIKLQKESRVRFAFHQDILLMPDKKIAIKGKIIGVALNAKGRPFIPAKFEDIITNNT